jgi:citrate synthase
MLAAYERLRNGKEPVAPDAKLQTAANFLYMVHGEKQSESKARAFDTYLMLLVEHSMNASTFTARSTISSSSDYYSAITAALGSLKGVAHGGANMMAMKMLLEIGDPNKIRAYVDESLQIKRRLMGIGHRIYKTRDPRVNHLMAWSEKIADEVGDDTWYQLAHNMEVLTNDHPYFTERKLYPNVEFYSAPLLYNLGFQPDLMPAVFALSRIGGWSANLMSTSAQPIRSLCRLVSGANSHLQSHVYEEPRRFSAGVLFDGVDDCYRSVVSDARFPRVILTEVEGSRSTPSQLEEIHSTALRSAQDDQRTSFSSLIPLKSVPGEGLYLPPSPGATRTTLREG